MRYVLLQSKTGVRTSLKSRGRQTLFFSDGRTDEVGTSKAIGFGALLLANGTDYLLLSDDSSKLLMTETVTPLKLKG